MRRYLMMIVLGLASIATAQTSVPGWNVTGGGGGASNGGGISPVTNGFLVTASPYNAKCDGSTNDLTAIQAAIAAASTAGGGTVVFPLGTCAISGTLTITTAGITLIGQGVGSSTIKEIGATTADIIDVSGNTTQIRNLLLTRSALGTSTSAGISITAGAQDEIFDVQSFDSQFGFNFAATISNIKVDKSWAVASLGTIAHGFFFGGQLNSSWFTDDNAIAAGGVITNGFDFAGGVADIFLIRPQTNQGVANGINFAGNAEDIRISQPILDFCTLTCIKITNSNGGVFGLPNDITFVDTFANAFNTSTNPIIITNSTGVKLIGGQVNCQGAVDCIVLQTGAKRNVVNGVQMAVTAGSTNTIPLALITSTDNVISNNMVTCVVACSIAFDFITTSTGNVISGNFVNGTGTTAYNFDSGSGKNQFFGNHADMTSFTNRVLDAGTGNSKNWSDQGSCTMTAGACAAQTLGSGTYSTAPLCTLTWTGTGTLTGILKVASTATTVTPTSSVGTDTAVVNYQCWGN
jgi:hypothetical protein